MNELINERTDEQMNEWKERRDSGIGWEISNISDLIDKAIFLFISIKETDAQKLQEEYNRLVEGKISHFTARLQKP